MENFTAEIGAIWKVLAKTCHGVFYSCNIFPVEDTLVSLKISYKFSSSTKCKVLHVLL